MNPEKNPFEQPVENIEDAETSLENESGMETEPALEIENAPETEEEAETPSEYNLSFLESTDRAQLIAEKTAEGDEAWASEVLQCKQPLSPEEIDSLIEIIQDPGQAFNALSLDYATGERMSADQKEKLLAIIAEDTDQTRFFLSHFEEAGMVDDPDTEKSDKWLIGKLQEILEQD